MNSVVPVALFAYNRPTHLQRTLESLRENQIPLIYAFSDGPKTPGASLAVEEVRRTLRSIDWCDVRLTERPQNMGLGKSILTGVSEVFRRHDELIVFEDDLICVPGTYRYLCAALERYREEQRVMSVTGWTHPLGTPTSVTDQPYFDGRAECWVWGAWKRSWQGMETDALTLMKQCERNGIDVTRYGSDLPEMAKNERVRNIWAVRFLYLHLFRGGLCLRPPWSMVEHIGFDPLGTNVTGPLKWAAGTLRSAPPIPDLWPEATENPECSALWRREFPPPSLMSGVRSKLAARTRERWKSFVSRFQR